MNKCCFCAGVMPEIDTIGFHLNCQVERQKKLLVLIKHIEDLFKVHHERTVIKPDVKGQVLYFFSPLIGTLELVILLNTDSKIDN